MEISRSVNVCFLALLVTLSGCFGLTNDEAEAADSDDGDTIVNNYYNNTTTIHLWIQQQDLQIQ